jgi:hypothetical protein
MRLCLRCGTIKVSRKYCKPCARIIKSERLKNRYNSLTKIEKRLRYKCGTSICTICKQPLIKTKKTQFYHVDCYKKLARYKNYNEYDRDKNGSMVGRSMVDKVYSIPDGWQVHHIDCNPDNNTFTNFIVLDSVLHKRLHALIRKSILLNYRQDYNYTEEIKIWTVNFLIDKSDYFYF